MAAYYNEIDPFKAEILREAISADAIAPGDVDERSIADVQPTDLVGYAQCHFFAGGGFWSLALRNAGWPDKQPVWTGSCPCPSFSAAGKGQGFDDPRHLWPHWARLIASAALQSSLESRLVPRLDTAGSTLFKLTWKHKTTPLGRSYLERQASVLRTSGKDFTSWRSPNTRLNGGGDYSDPEKAAKRLEQGHQLNLSEEALIASWPTPQTHDDKLRGNTGADNHSFPHDLSNASTLASWPTPRNEDAEGGDAPQPPPLGRIADGETRLTAQASLTGWRSPNRGCETWQPAGQGEKRLGQLPR